MRDPVESSVGGVRGAGARAGRGSNGETTRDSAGRLPATHEYAADGGRRPFWSFSRCRGLVPSVRFARCFVRRQKRTEIGSSLVRQVFAAVRAQGPVPGGSVLLLPPAD